MPPLDPPSNPFVGPRSIPDNYPIFGRDWEISELHDMVVAERTVLLFGPSGCGKTSLLSAQRGVICELKQTGFASLSIARLDRPPNMSATLRNRYFASVCATALGREMEELGESTDNHLLELILTHVKELDEPRVLLVMDAFERLLTLDPDDFAAKRHFLELLDELAARSPKLFVIVAMREEFVARMEEIARPVRPSARFRLGLLDGSDAVEAIIGPARQHQVQLPMDYVQRVARNLAASPASGDAAATRADLPEDWITKPVVEPLHLQLVCHRLWPHWKQQSAQAQFDENEPARLLNETVDDALLAYYRETLAIVLKSTRVQERLLREFMAEKLITKSGLRDQMWLEEAVDFGIPAPTLDLLEDCYLLRSDQRGNRFSYEISHDRLVRPVKDDYGKWLLSNLTSFQILAIQYENDPSSAWLLGAAELRTARRWAKQNPESMTPKEVTFLAASERRQRRWRWILLGTVGVVVAIALAVALTKYGDIRQARQDQRDEAIKESADRADRARKAETDRHARLNTGAATAAFAARVGDFALAKSTAATAIEAAQGINVPDPFAQANLVSASLLQWYVNRFAKSGTEPPWEGYERAPYTSLTLSADGKWIAVGRSYKDIEIADAGPPMANKLEKPESLRNKAVERVFLTSSPDAPQQLYAEVRELRGGSSLWRASAKHGKWNSFEQLYKCDGLVGLAISPDGAHAIAGFSRVVKGLPTYEVATLDLEAGTQGCPEQSAVTQTSKPIDRLSISRSGRMAAAGSAQSGELLLLRDSPTGFVPVTKASADPIIALTFDSEETQLAVAQSGGVLRVYSLDPGKLSLSDSVVIASGREAIVDVAFLDPDRLAVADETPVVRVWDLASRRPALALMRDDTAPTQIAVAPDHSLYSAGQDGKFLIWPAGALSDDSVVDLSTLIRSFCSKRDACTRSWLKATQPRTVAVRPDLAEVAIGYSSGDVFVYSRTSRHIVRQLRSTGAGAARAEIVKIAYSPDGDLVALGDHSGRIEVYAAPDMKLLYSSQHADYVSGLSFATRAEGLRLLSSSWDGRLALHDFKANTAVFEPSAPRNVAGAGGNVNWQYNSLSVSQQDQRVILTRNNGPIVQLLADFPHNENLYPDLPQAASNKVIWADSRGSILVDAGLDGIQRVHDLRRGVTTTLPRYSARVIKQMWGPGGMIIFSLNADAVIRAYDVVNLRELFSIQLPASRDTEYDPFVALDMHFDCHPQGTSNDVSECALAATLGNANRILLLDIPNIRNGNPVPTSNPRGQSVSATASIP